MSSKPTVRRCALKTGHEGPHLWVNTRLLGQLGECRAFSPPITDQLAAMILGRKGGLASSERKAVAVRENGKKGGRPKKPRV